LLRPSLRLVRLRSGCGPLLADPGMVLEGGEPLLLPQAAPDSVCRFPELGWGSKWPGEKHLPTQAADPQQLSNAALAWASGCALSNRRFCCAMASASGTPYTRSRLTPPSGKILSRM